MKVCLSKKKENKTTKKTVKKNFLQWESNPEPSECKVNALPIVPCQLMLNRIIELIIFITFAYEILPLEGVWTWWSLIYEELKDVFQETSIVLRVKAVLKLISLPVENIWQTKR